MLAATIVYALVVLQPWEYRYRLEYHINNGLQLSGELKRSYHSATYGGTPIEIKPLYPSDFNPNADDYILNLPDPSVKLPMLPGWDYDKKTKRFFRTNLSRKDIQERARIEGYEDSVNGLLQ